ncbi:MAG: hypothetical protein M1826_004806 [Phylliscum demangeonii]|nr:MAG: hypothetical protein M1826_004806 [Phylliscum demangeonii]
MKAVVVEKAGAPFKVVEGIEKPTPGSDQILIKSIFVAINPVDSFQRNMGMLVDQWPAVLGCDAGGVVVDVGKDASAKFKKGDQVCGCTRLGVPGYTPYQEYFLMDAKLALKAPKSISLEQACTVGVGSYTACLGIFTGFGIPLVDVKNPPKAKDEWMIVLGGAGSVGQYCVQLGKAAGYKLLATCSTKSAGAIKSLGATATIDYRKSEDEQVQEIASVTGGKFSMVYDAVAKSHAFARRLLTDVSKSSEKKHFATTDDWSEIAPWDGIKMTRVALGPIGRTGDALKHQPSLNEDVAAFIPMLEDLLAAGKLVPNEYTVVGKEGLQSIIEAYDLLQKSGGTGPKLIAKIQSP